MASSVTPSMEDSSSTEPPLRGVLKKPGNLRRRTLIPSPPSSILFSLEEDNYNKTPNLENSYKMSPDISFSSEGARRLAEDILSRTFHGVKYEPEKCRELVVKASEELKDSVKALGCNRFKFVCVVYLGPLQSQGMCIASRCMLDERFDRCATATYRSHSLYAVATIYGLYRE
ncbi:dynein light chain Tctex-type 5-B-like [Oculina patagonica]